MKKTIITFCAVTVTVMFLSTCSGDDSNELTNEVTIGSQVWMAKNLDVSLFRNGEPIPEAKTDEEWQKAGDNKQPAWCYYDNDPANGMKYGKLYNWYAVNDPRGLAPAGYHVPTEAEVTQLIDYCGGEEVAGEKMKSSSGWYRNGNGTNISGFSGLPGGFRSIIGSFSSIGYTGDWWSSTAGGTANAWGFTMYYNYGGVTKSNYEHEAAFYVRCLRD